MALWRLVEITKATSSSSSYSYLGILLLARMVIDLDFLAIILFFGVFHDTFNIEIWALGFLISIYSIFTLFSPIFGILSDQYGRRSFLNLGLILFAFSSMLTIFAQSWIHIFIARALAGLAGRGIFLPTLLAELGDFSTYEKRTFSMGIVRLSWPITFMLGIPLVGFTIENLDWRLPFLLMGIFTVTITAIMIIFTKSFENKTLSRNTLTLAKFELIKNVLLDQSAISGLILTLFAVGSIQGIFAYFSVWLESDFQLGETEISVIYAFMGLGTLFGTLLATGFGDKVGTKTCAVLGLVVAAGGMVVLSNFSFNPIFVIIWLVFLGTAFDFSMTAVPALLTQITDATGTILSLNQALNAAATAIGTAISGFLWIHLGYPMIGLFFGITALIGALIGFIGIRVKKPVINT
ncbi:MAG: MFS transporter [Candidatus Heimdallarchaeota archaeon]|nr:MAG: MFS transporter [Candidatus Heimdallarchaeota archaeon]